MVEAETKGRKKTREQEAAVKRRQRLNHRTLEIPKPVSPERRAACEADVFCFLQTYFPDTFDQPFTDDRREMVELITQAGTVGVNQALAAPRGEGKTTITEKCVLWLILTGRVRFVVLFAATGPKASDMLENIKLAFLENEVLRADYPEMRVPIDDLNGAPQAANGQNVNGEPVAMKWSAGYIRLPQIDGFAGSGVRVQTFGLDSAVRGLKKGDVRPDLVVIDDPETEESVDSDVQTSKRRRIIERAIKGLRGPGKRFGCVMLTTIQNRHCLSYQYTDPHGASSWAGRRLKFFRSWPDRDDLWQDYMDLRKECQRQGDPTARKAHRFYLQRREEMDAGAELGNPYRFISDELPDGSQVEVSAIQHAYNIICDGVDGKEGEDARSYFLTEYQNDPPEEDEPITSSITERIVRERVNGFERGVVPNECQHLVAMIDVGKRRLHWSVCAWNGDGTKGWVVDYGEKLTGKPDIVGAESAIRVALDEMADEWRTSPYHDTDGRRVDIHKAFVDSGHWNAAIYDFCKAHKSFWQPSMGLSTRFSMPKQKGRDKRPGHGGPWYESKQRPGLWVVNFEPNYWKHRVHELFQAEDCGITLFGDNPYAHQEFSQHICAEIWTEETIEKAGVGKAVRRYFRTIRHDNHYFDAMVGCCVAGCMARNAKKSRGAAARRRKPKANQAKNEVFQMLGPDGRPRVSPGSEGVS